MSLKYFNSDFSLNIGYNEMTVNHQNNNNNISSKLFW